MSRTSDDLAVNLAAALRVDGGEVGPGGLDSSNPSLTLSRREDSRQFEDEGSLEIYFRCNRHRYSLNCVL
jgi:hypothetical protein